MNTSESASLLGENSKTSPPLPDSTPKASGSARDKTAAKLFVRSSKESNEDSEKEAIPVNTVVTSPDVGVLVFGPDRKIISANDICAAMFGWSNLPGQDVAVLIKDGIQNEFGEILKQGTKDQKGSERFSLRVMAKRKDKSEFPASVILTVSTAGGKACWTVIFQDLESMEEGLGNTTFLRNASGELHRHAQSMAVEAVSYREEFERVRAENEELQAQLEELTKFKLNLEDQLEQQGRTNEELLQSLSESHEALDEIKSNASEQEAELGRDTAQIERLKEDLLEHKKTVEELTEQLRLEQESSAGSLEQNQDLQRQLEKARLDLDQVKTGQDQQTKSLVEELESLRQQLEADQAAALQTESRLDQESQRVRELEEKLASPAGESIAELNGLREQEKAWERQQSELENRLSEINGAMARAHADLEKERRERRRLEQRNAALSTQLQKMHEELKHHLETESTSQDRFSELDRQLLDQETKVSRLQSELEKITADFQLADEQLRAAGDMTAELDRYRSLFEESKVTFQQTREQLETQVQTSQRALRESESKLDYESRERQRLQDLMAKLQRELQEQTEQSRLELTKLKSELQVEQLDRKRLEGGAVQSRYATLDSARSGRALVNRLHQQVREPVEDLLASTRKLLESELPEHQKTVLESMLEKALLVQTNLQEVKASLPVQPLAGKTDAQPRREPSDASSSAEEQAA